MDAQFSAGTLRSLNVPDHSNASQSRSKRPFIILGSLLGIFVISTGVLAAIVALKSKNTEKIVLVNNSDLCVTPYCVKAANYLLESIDESVDPCEDFYHFVCRTWIENTRIPDDAGAANTFNLLRTQLDFKVVDILSSPIKNDTDEPKAVMNARILYHSCIDEQKIEDEGVDLILSLINDEFGGWPILQGSSWNDSTFNLLNILTKLRTYSNNILFAMDTSTDEKNSTEYDIEIGQSDLGLSQRQYYLNETKITIAYRQFIYDLANELTNDTSMIEQDVKDIYEFEKEISKHHWTSAEQRARANESIRTTVGELKNALNISFDFTNYIRASYAVANIAVLDTDIITVDEVAYLNNVSSIIDRTPARTLQNYIIWRFMMRRADNMPKRFRSIKSNFDHVFRGTTADRSRSIICGNYVNGNMGFAVSKIYIQKYFDQVARNQSFEMIGNIRKAFIDMLQDITWMDETSKRKAVEKAQAIDEKIGYPDYLASDNVTELEKQYAEYVFNSSYISNIIQLLRLGARNEFKTLRKPVNRKAWGSTAPTVVNAFYAPSKNQITFPAGILQMPFFDKDAPKYLNYGGIGVVIGHEITHGFDDSGRQFDKDGNRIPWWTDETVENFIDRKTCIVDQYSNFTIHQLNMKANGNQTQGEDIADNGGLREAYFAYQNWKKNNGNDDKKLPGFEKYSAEQMFFINYAHTWCSKMTNSYALNLVLSDVHSLGPLRVLGPTSNFIEFDRAFNCKPGQGNSRVKKCTVW